MPLNHCTGVSKYYFLYYKYNFDRFKLYIIYIWEVEQNIDDYILTYIAEIKTHIHVIWYFTNFIDYYDIATQFWRLKW